MVAYCFKQVKNLIVILLPLNKSKNNGYFADFGQFQKDLGYFADFAQLVILLTLNK